MFENEQSSFKNPRYFSQQLHLNLSETPRTAYPGSRHLPTECVIAIIIAPAWCCELSLLLSLWPAVNEHNCSADISTILESKAQLDHLVNHDCSDFTEKIIYKLQLLLLQELHHLQQFHITLLFFFSCVLVTVFCFSPVTVEKDLMRVMKFLLCCRGVFKKGPASWLFLFSGIIRSLEKRPKKLSPGTLTSEIVLY